MKYIDAEKLIAEIKRLQKRYLVAQDKFKFDDADLSIFYEGKAKMCGEILNIIYSLQQEEPTEVDLEEEIIAWWDKHYSREDYEFEKLNGHYIENTTLLDISRHFYELGLKARKD